jgi:pyruvate dehydrogenase E2 component (dihydrolipoamide acetyltransferase)
MPNVNMPRLSDTMEEGTVLEWKKQSGDQVRKGEVLAEIESDKASFEIEAEADGVLQIVVEQGTPAPVGDLIARIGAEGEEAPPKPAKAAEPPAEKAEKAEKPQEPAAQPETPEEERQAQPVAAQTAAPPEQPERSNGSRGAVADGAKASPLARRLARELGVDLSTIQGSGPNGRIVKDDVEAAAKSAGQTAPSRPAPRPAIQVSSRPSGPDVEVVQPSRMQATISKRMTLSKTTVPHFYITVEARVDDAVKLRQQLKETVPGAERLTMTDLITRAAAIALTRFPEVNASWVDDHFERKRAVNIGIAVPPADGMGLLVPVVHDCERKDLVQISMETRQVIERARSGRPGDGDLSGGTFSISNLGMYGVDEFSAIINPPESAILAVGQIKDAPVVEDGQIRAGKLMRLTLSVDHRVFYGAPAAQFAGEIKKLLENPAILLLPPDSV